MSYDRKQYEADMKALQERATNALSNVGGSQYYQLLHTIEYLAARRLENASGPGLIFR